MVDKKTHTSQQALIIPHITPQKNFYSLPKVSNFAIFGDTNVNKKDMKHSFEKIILNFEICANIRMLILFSN
jgi:hypothetical protein